MLALTVLAAPAPPPAAPLAATANLVTKADLQATGAQLGQKIAAQTDQITALRQQLLTLKAQLEALDRQVNGLKVPVAPASSRVLPGH